MTPQERIARFNTFVAEGRIIRGEWHGTDAEGRETACLLGSFGKDIDAADKCPAELMWPWLAHLTIPVNDCGSLKAWPGIVDRYAAVLPKLHRLDAAAQRRCLAKTMIASLLIALPHDTHHVVGHVIALWQRDGTPDSPSSDEWRRAEAAAAAARAARAARDQITSACLTAIEDEIKVASAQADDQEKKRT